MMRKTTNFLQEEVNNGWAIQIYRSDRRLLCSLYPSHGWAFLAGLIIGCFMTVLGLQGQVVPHPSPTDVPPVAAPPKLD
ncbi:hypothetical protein ACQ4M4_02755 [Leptolyngbya sp. AN02str]|uniref:hypothetical protein n=1 Tax=Leptolyngbya sp. AN02str TaxID=3423363 RepID=UPI003D3196EC